MKAKSYAFEALRIDDALPEVHTALGSAYWISWEIKNAGSELKRAIELNPNFATEHHFYSIWLRYMKRFDEALPEAEIARELDPYSPIINTAYCAYFVEIRDYERAIEELKKALEIFPEFRNMHDYLGIALVLHDRFSEGIAELEKGVLLSGNDPGTKANLAYGYARAGNSAKAEKILEELKESSSKLYVSPLAIAIVYSGLGRRDEAIEYLYKAYEERTGNFPQTIVLDGIWDTLREDPRFI
jgi:tetratricopeptide (TPR) repeat protein